MPVSFEHLKELKQFWGTFTGYFNKQLLSHGAECDMGNIFRGFLILQLTFK